MRHPGVHLWSLRWNRTGRSGSALTTLLNWQLIRERVIVPTVEENLKPASAKVFSELSANSGYWQMPLAPEFQDFTIFITLFGRLQFPQLPSGIATVPELFHREMLCILEKLACHQDDISIFGKDLAEHNANLTAVLQQLWGLLVKCSAKVTSNIVVLGTCAILSISKFISIVA